MRPAIHGAEDAHRLARGRLPWMLFDDIDGAAGAGTGAARAKSGAASPCRSASGPGKPSTSRCIRAGRSPRWPFDAPDRASPWPGRAYRDLSDPRA